MLALKEISRTHRQEGTQRQPEPTAEGYECCASRLDGVIEKGPGDQPNPDTDGKGDCQPNQFDEHSEHNIGHVEYSTAGAGEANGAGRSPRNRPGERPVSCILWKPVAAEKETENLC